MKGFQKLALVTAIAAAPFAAQAELTAMDDALLSEMTGQAGVSLDLHLNMVIDEIRYVDEDGTTGAGGYLTLSNLVIDGDQGAANNQAIINNLTIDVDGTNGIVVGFGEIGGESSIVQDTATTYDLSAIGGSATSTSAQAAAINSDYWTGVNVSTEFGINGASAGVVAIKGLTNFVPNALAVEAVSKFGYSLDGLTGDIIALTDATGANTGTASGGTHLSAIGQSLTAIATGASTKGAQVLTESTGFAEALVAGTYVEGNVRIAAGGATDSDTDGTTQGLTISATAGFVINELSFTDDGNSMGLHNFVMFDTAVDGTITGFQITGLTIDVVDHANANAGEAIQIAGMNTSGTIAIGDIFVGDATNGSLGGLSIKGINMSNTQIYVYGH